MTRVSVGMVAVSLRLSVVLPDGMVRVNVSDSVPPPEGKVSVSDVVTLLLGIVKVCVPVLLGRL